MKDLVLSKLGKVSRQDKQGNYMALCPFHEDHRPSLSINFQKDVYQCFACHSRGKIQRLAQRLGIEVNGEEGCNAAAGIKTETEAFEKLKRRGLREETIEHFGITSDIRKQAWQYPLPSGHKRWKAFKSSSTKKYWHEKGTPNQLYGLDDIPEGTEEIFVANGEPAVWICYQAKIPAVCGIYGEGQLPEGTLKALLTKGAKTITVVPDLDSAGRYGALQAFNSLKGAPALRYLDPSDALEFAWLELPSELGEGADLADLYVWCGGDDQLFRQKLTQLPRRQFSELVDIEDAKAGPRRQIALDGRVYAEKEGRLFVTYRQGGTAVEKTLTSFVIRPDLRIAVDGQAELLKATLKVDQKQYSDILFKRESWNSKQKFLGALPAVDLQFFGSDLDVQAILALLTQDELPMRKGTPLLGRNGNLWVVRDGVLSKDGWLKDPELIYIPSELEFDRRLHYPAIDDEAGLVSEVVPALLTLNIGKIIFPVIGWFFATPFTPEIRERLGHFPILVVWGTHGGGKSSLLRLMWGLFGVKSELFSSTETPFTFLRLLSGTSSIPILIDEFKPFNMGEDEVRLLIRYLKRLYDGEVEHRGRPDLSLIAYKLQAPVAIAGETTPVSLETAMAERVLQVNLNPDVLGESSPYTSAFRKLSLLDLRGFAPIYIRWCLGADIANVMCEAKALLPKLLSVPGRVIDNLLVMNIGLVSFRRFAADYGINLPTGPFREGIEESTTAMVSELLQRGPRQETGLTLFLETLATMAATVRIKRDIHYTTENNTKLYVQLEDCLAEFRKFVRETNARIEVLDKNAYQKQIREVHVRGGYIINPSTTHWFRAYETEEGAKGRVRRCVEIDMESLPFDTSGFEEPQ